MGADADYTVGSNAFYILAVAWLLYKGLWTRYFAEACTILLCIPSSIYYHLCWSSDLRWCVNDDDIELSRRDQDVFLSRDLLFSYMALVGTGVIVADLLWWAPLDPTLKPRWRGAARACAFTSEMLLTWFVVVHAGDEWVTEAALPSVGVIQLLLAVMMYRSRLAKTKQGPGWLFWLLLASALAMGAIGAGLRWYANYADFHSDQAVQSDEYLDWHGDWHVLTALSSFALVVMATLQPSGSEYQALASKNSPTGL